MITLEFLVTSLVVVLIPGTGVLYTVSIGLLCGSRASVFAALGCTLGIVPSFLASLLGLAVIIHTSALAFQTVKYLGVAYLMYLAWSIWRSSGVLTLDAEHSPQSLLSVAVKGLLINTLNPKLTLFFLAFLPQFLPMDTTAHTQSLVVMGSVFMVMTLLVFILYGLLATRVRETLINSAVAAKYVQRTFAGAFALMGLKLAFSER